MKEKTVLFCPKFKLWCRYNGPDYPRVDNELPKKSFNVTYNEEFIWGVEKETTSFLLLKRFPTNKYRIKVERE